MKTFFRWLLASLGYIAYTVVVVVVLLWILFPSDSALLWMQRKLNTQYPFLVWDIGGLEKHFPMKIELSDILVYEKNDRNEPILHITGLQLAPAVEKLMDLNKQVPIAYRLKTLGGTVQGDLQISDDGSMVHCSGEMKNLLIADFTELWRRTDRSGSGRLSGTFQYYGIWNNLRQGTLRADIQVRDGSISLRQKILGLDRIDFQSMTTNLNIKDRVASIENGYIDSRLFKANFAGTLKLTGNLYTSAISIKGDMEPRSELLGGLKTSASASFIRGQLQNDKLAFIINGTLVEPGILFKGASGIIDGIIEGGVR